MSIAVIVPWGTDNGPRERVWQKVRPEWEKTGCNLIVAADPLFSARGKFSVSRAINNAVRLAPPEYDKFVLFGADMAPDPGIVAWAGNELADQPWTLLYNAGNSQTERGGWTPVEMFASPCVGPIAFTRTTFEKVGGFDQRYEGWAYEDVDLWLRLQRDVPRTAPQTYHVANTLQQYWHPTSHHDLSQENPNVRLFAETWG